MASMDNARYGISKRQFLTGVAAMATSGVLAACGSLGRGGDTTPAPQAADLKGVTVEYWNSWAPTHPEEMARQKVLENFTNQNPHGIKVDTATAAGQTAANMDKIIGALAAGTPPDLVNNFHFRLSLLFARGGLVDVDSELKGNAEWRKVRPSIYPNIAAGHTWRGKLFSVPTHNSYFLMYYQPNYLKRAGLAAPPPKAWNWDQFLDYCRKASRPPEITGYDDQFSYSRTGMMVLNNGHRFISQDGTKFSYNSPEALETVEFQLNMIKQGLMRAHDGSGGGGYSEKLPEGKVVFQFGVAARVPAYRRDGIEFGTCFYPLGPKNTTKANYTHGEAYGFGVFKNQDARRVQAALLAAMWASRPDSGLIFADVGGVVPAYKHIVEAPEFQATFKKDAEIWPRYEILPNYFPMPNFPGFDEVRSLGDRMIRDIWAGKGTAREILNEYTRLAQLQLDEALRGG